MHSLPGGHRQSAPVDGARPMGCAAAARVITGHDGCVNLRTGPGRPESGAHCFEIFSEGSRVMHQRNNGFQTTTPVSFSLNGKTVACRPDETILEVAQKQGVEIPRLCYMEGL